MEAFAVVEDINQPLFQIYSRLGWSLKGAPLPIIGSAFLMLHAIPATDQQCQNCESSVEGFVTLMYFCCLCDFLSTLLLKLNF